MVVLSNPSDPSREDEFNQWYDQIHLPDVLRIEGVVAATRYRISDTRLDPTAPVVHGYMALYEIEAEDPGAVLNALTAGAATGALRMSDVLQMDPMPSLTIFEQITDRVTAAPTATRA